MYPRDGSSLQISTQGRAADAVRMGLLEAGRHHVQRLMAISHPDGGSGTTIVELPATLTVEQAHPKPHRAGTVHGRSVLMSRDCAALRRMPVVQARRR